MNWISFLNRGYAFKGLLAVFNQVFLLILCLKSEETERKLFYFPDSDFEF